MCVPTLKILLPINLMSSQLDVDAAVESVGAPRGWMRKCYCRVHLRRRSNTCLAWGSRSRLWRRRLRAHAARRRRGQPSLTKDGPCGCSGSSQNPRHRSHTWLICIRSYFTLHMNFYIWNLKMKWIEFALFIISVRTERLRVVGLVTFRIQGTMIWNPDWVENECLRTGIRSIKTGVKREKKGNIFQNQTGATLPWNLTRLDLTVNT